MNIFVKSFLMGGRTQIYENLQPSHSIMADLVPRVI